MSKYLNISTKRYIFYMCLMCYIISLFINYNSSESLKVVYLLLDRACLFTWNLKFFYRYTNGGERVYWKGMFKKDSLWWWSGRIMKAKAISFCRHNLHVTLCLNYVIMQLSLKWKNFLALNFIDLYFLFA